MVQARAGVLRVSDFEAFAHGAREGRLKVRMTGVWCDGFFFKFVTWFKWAKGTVHAKE